MNRREHARPPSIQRGVAYLGARLDAGEYGLGAVCSDGSVCPADNTGHVFLAYFLVEALADDLTARGRDTLVSRIRQEERHGLWGSGPHLQVDADDTAFVLRALRRLGEPASIRPLLAFRRRSVGAFTTFLSRLPDRIATEPSVVSNEGIHPEVNANVFRCLAESGRLDLTNPGWLAGLQREDGSWPSYFYPSPYYAIFVVTDFLCEMPRCAGACERATEYVEVRQNPDGSWGVPGNAYETALAILTLCRLGRFRPVDSGAAWIAARQAPDGGWAAGPPVYEYLCSENPRLVWLGLDSGGIMTTALCVMALRAVGWFAELRAPCSTLS